jgi:hypothetical protein
LMCGEQPIDEGEHGRIVFDNENCHVGLEVRWILGANIIPSGRPRA